MAFETIEIQEAFITESGKSIDALQIAFHSFGEMNADKSNVVWICHAFTANSNPSEWWPGMVGEGKFFNPKEDFIICANVLGSCYGTTGPLSTDIQTGKPFYLYFPPITVRDMVQAHILLAQHLGIESINLLVGASVGGHQAIEWAVTKPSQIQNLILMETNAEFHPWGRAFNASQQMAIESDLSFHKCIPSGGMEGMKVARSIALLSYRNAHAYNSTQQEENSTKTDNYKAHSYQKYQGEKLAKRFNAYSYYYLSKALDSHHIGRNRGATEDILKTISARTLIIAVSSDILFSIEEQRYMERSIPNSEMHIIDSDYGHDGFLLESETLTKLFSNFSRKL